MNERIYRTPRTYGNPTGYDAELTHYPNLQARMAERLVMEMVSCDAYSDCTSPQLAARAGAIAAALVDDWQMRGWLLPVEDAPGMAKDYGATRGTGEKK